MLKLNQEGKGMEEYMGRNLGVLPKKRSFGVNLFGCFGPIYCPILSCFDALA